MILSVHIISVLLTILRRINKEIRVKYKNKETSDRGERQRENIMSIYFDLQLLDFVVVVAVTLSLLNSFQDGTSKNDVL
jgi:hypothetical protein